MTRLADRRLPLLLLLAAVSGFGACESARSYTRLGTDASLPGSGGTTEDSGSPTRPDEGDAGAQAGGGGGDTPVGVGGAAGGSTGTGGRSGTGGSPATGGAGGGAGQGAAGALGGHGGRTPGTGGIAGSSTGGRGGAIGSGGNPGSGSGGTTATGGAAGGSTGGSAGGAGGRGASGGASSGGAGGAAQRILSLDFIGGMSMGGVGGVSGTVQMAPSEIAGVKPAANWNGAPGPTGSLTALLLSDGTTASGASVSWNAPTNATGAGVFALGYADMPGDIRMLNGYLDPAWSAVPSSPTTVVTFSDLPATVTAGGYDVYVYVVGSIMSTQTRGYNYALGTAAFHVTQTGPTSTSPPSPYPYVLAPDGGSGNYVVFRNVMGSTFSLQVKPDAGGSVLRSPINGMQIVWPSGS